MKILVERLSTSPTELQFEGDAIWWASAAPEAADLPRELAEPFRFEVSAYRMGEDVYLDGSASGEIELECSRCLARYRQPLREPFRLVLEPAGARVPADPEGAAALARYGLWLGDELEAGWFRGSELHLGGLFYEVVSLALPVKPLCREDCPGLCAHCGADLAEGSCSCSGASSASPFAVLAKLRPGNPRGGS